MPYLSSDWFLLQFLLRFGGCAPHHLLAYLQFLRIPSSAPMHEPEDYVPDPILKKWRRLFPMENIVSSTSTLNSAINSLQACCVGRNISPFFRHKPLASSTLFIIIMVIFNNDDSGGNTRFISCLEGSESSGAITLYQRAFCEAMAVKKSAYAFRPNKIDDPMMLYCIEPAAEPRVGVKGLPLKLMQ